MSGWVSADSEGDKAFRDAFGDYVEFSRETESGGAFSYLEGMSALLVIGVAALGVGGSMMFILRKGSGWKGMIAIFLITLIVMFGLSALTEEDETSQSEKLLAYGKKKQEV